MGKEMATWNILYNHVCPFKQSDNDYIERRRNNEMRARTSYTEKFKVKVALPDITGTIQDLISRQMKKEKRMKLQTRSIEILSKVSLQK